MFNISDHKAVKINKLLGNLQTSSWELLSTSKKPTSPKTAATNWFNKSQIPTTFRVDQDDGDFFEHESHSYPEFSESRAQHEYNCIDPGHTLANMRSQISRYDYEFCRKAAFIKVSETNHKVLPKWILEDSLDRQSIRIVKYFFSSDVDKELTKNGDTQEANFVHLVGNWFEACNV